MTSHPIRDFIVATRSIKEIRAEHAPALKQCRETKRATQEALQRVLRAHNTTCVPVDDQYVRLKTQRSARAVTEEVIRTALDDAAAAMAADVQRVHTV